MRYLYEFVNFRIDGIRYTGDPVDPLFCETVEFDILKFESEEARSLVEKIKLQNCLIENAEDQTLFFDENRTPLYRADATMRLILKSEDPQCDKIASRFWNLVASAMFQECWVADTEGDWSEIAEEFFYEIIATTCKNRRAECLEAVVTSLVALKNSNQKLYKSFMEDIGNKLSMNIWIEKVDEWFTTRPDVIIDLNLGLLWTHNKLTFAKLASLMMEHFSDDANMAVKNAVEYIGFKATGFFYGFEADEILPLLTWLDTCSIESLKNARIISKLCQTESHPLVSKEIEDFILKIITRYKGCDLHHECDSALRNAVINKYPDVAKELIFQGSNIGAAYPNSKDIHAAAGKAKRIVEEFKPLHDLLRKQKQIPETEYRKYYSTKGCVRIAQEFGTFAMVEDMYKAEGQNALDRSRFL